MPRIPGYHLIVALPNPGQPGSPRGLFYQHTSDGHAMAEEFARREERPGWGVFECACSFKEASWEIFEDVVQRALEHPHPDKGVSNVVALLHLQPSKSWRSRLAA